MSADRVTLFVCDVCGKQEISRDYKLPRGFIYCPEIIGAKDSHIRHKCGECIEKEKRENDGLYNLI